jgi:hypothetical protein
MMDLGDLMASMDISNFAAHRHLPQHCNTMND